ncbi:putative palmitoyltransferase ZDHHC8 [Babesia sp. Xinjiang]|uniref:putative palmitoyltransferase ZDHHC8 n=1 Tax=Babesia sp. Xinjiang TaxID=462227 RepID=UPI000A24F9DD|nr:putative palmitoyltransferase ZDHHC8 [Babesia sp. Xinjiang]ORM39811.1 putative palmitoyltransferase ZDHHC8 [Babesia sp. Xinjiang]
MEPPIEDDVAVYHAIPSEPGVDDEDIVESEGFGPNPNALMFSVSMTFAEWIQMLWVTYLIETPLYYIVFTLLFAILFILMALVNVSNPGVMTKNTDLELYKNEGAPATAVELRNGRFIQRWCVTCHIYKPPRVKHCYECRQCVVRFDHHCPWLSNCIGGHNYKIFVMFWLWYLITECYALTVILSCIKKLSDITKSAGLGSGLRVFASNHTFLFIITVVACIHTLLVVYNVLGNAYFVARNMTYYEFLTRPYQGSNPFDNGIYRNLKHFWSLPWLDIRS